MTIKGRVEGNHLRCAGGRRKTPFDIFEDLYEKQNNQEMNEEQKQLIHSLIEKIWEDKN